MFLGRVIGRIVATHRSESLGGERFLLVRPLDEKGSSAGDTLVACDTVDSGPGDMVHVCDGREAAMALHEPFAPVDATVVGHVEEFETTPSNEGSAE
ncbi:MAG: EutN/CcmL family microcompartment protein [Planctomycetota bacterium]|nr:EutN/CcmL family microcompartment protein [Planctomycetota bacterium]